MNEVTTATVMLSVVIPALNEENGIADIVGRLERVLPSLEAVGVQNLEIIVVDDGSTDRTAEVAARSPLVRVVKHEKNRGYGAAIKTGFAEARGELLAFTDADGTYPPERFDALCQAILRDGADVVVGSRRSGEASEMPLVRQIGNFVWSNLVSLIGNHRVADPASGMRVIRRDVLEKLYPLPDGLNFTPVMSTRSVHEDLKVVEVPIAYRERVGRSKLSVVRDGIRFLTTIVGTSLEYNPVKVLGMLGLLSLGLAAIIGVALLGIRIQGVTRLDTWWIFGVFSALVLSVAGVSLFGLGVTFNYLVTLFHRRPVRQGLFGRPLFDPPLESRFGWLGLGATLAGGALGIGSVWFSLSGWDAARLWFWLVLSALLTLVGFQLILSWILTRVLERLSQREVRISVDLPDTFSQSNRSEPTEISISRGRTGIASLNAIRSMPSPSNAAHRGAIE
ncbi:MAG: glycosyltransferase family 2 protein [Chloroflexota bacterium]